MIDSPLQGLKVLDFTRLLPGPYATLVLADLGAQVDKVEDPMGGDYVRQLPPFAGDVSALFATLNRNKRSLAIDLKSGAAIIRSMVRHYDIVFEGFRPGVMAKLGLGYDALAQENPKLIYCSLSGYGANGPDRLKAGHDINYLARAGVLGYSGTRGGPPALPGVQIADTGGALFSLVGMLAALHARERTGRGRHLDISMTESAMAFMHVWLGSRQLTGPEEVPLRRGEALLNGGVPCYGLYRTRDGRYLALGALEPKFFETLCEALGRPELADSAYDEGERGAKVRAELDRIFGAETAQHWMQTLAGLDICLDVVAEGEEIFDDPQHRARKMFEAISGEALMRTPLLSQLPRAAIQVPELGEHTVDILMEAGVAADQIAEWAREGIVTRP